MKGGYGMVCRGMNFDEVKRIANVKNYQLRESAKRMSENPVSKKYKSNGIYIEMKR